MRYIGSKERSALAIVNLISQHVEKGSTIGDLFCGTAKVSGALKEQGYRVIANDNMYFCTVIAKAILMISHEPRFYGLRDLPKSRNALFQSPYDDVLEYLNGLPACQGFLYHNYSLDGTRGTQYERSYFTGDNAGKIDAIREQIEQWYTSGCIDQEEKCLLINDLLNATVGVSNTAGTYGYFLNHFETRALKDLVLKRSRIVPGREDHLVFNNDANELARETRFDVVYLDPPYNWRQYAAYYHLLETIAKHDSPRLVGKSGLRPWQEQRSKYSIRGEALEALSEIIHNIKAKGILLSYNSDGILTHDQIMVTLNEVGTTTFDSVVVPRYTSISGGSNDQSVKEYLYYVSIENKIRET